MLSWLGEHILPTSRRNKTYLAYSHGFAIKCLLRGIMNFDPTHTYKLQIDNTSITRLQYKENGWNFASINDTAHLYNQK